MFLWTDPEITRIWVVSTGALVVFFFWFFSKGNGKHYLRNIIKINDDLENIETVPEALINIDEENCISKVNDRVEDIFGYMPTETVKSYMNKLLLEENMADFNAFKGRPFNKEVSLFLKTKHKNGDALDVEIVTRKYLDATGKIKYSVIVRDVSHRKKTELFLRQEFERQTLETHKRNLLLMKGEEIGRFGTWEWDLLTRKVDASVGFRKVFNVGLGDELNSDMLMKLVYPEDQEYVAKVINDAVSHLKPFYEMKYKRMQNNGKLADILCKGELVLNEDKTETVKVYGTIQVVD